MAAHPGSGFRQSILDEFKTVSDNRSDLLLTREKQSPRFAAGSGHSDLRNKLSRLSELEQANALP